jgi:two-component system sensor histidine kinase AlgZ
MKSDLRFVVPNLCKNSAVLMVVVAAQLLAIVVTLLLGQQAFLARLGLVSVYCQWVMLLSVLLLCLARTKLNSLSKSWRIAGAAFCCMGPFLVTELARQYWVNGFELHASNWRELWSFAGVAVILTLFALRLISLSSVLEQRSRAELEMRIQSLQSRIRPHFLFNSLNTIAQLTATQPEQAEQAIDSLSLLFRASLESEKRFHSLQSELDLCERYLDLERWRLAERLTMDWSVDVAEPSVHQVPKLILQPLLENAILHGVEEDGTINVQVDVRETKNDLSLVIENGISEEDAPVVESRLKGGNGIAVDNIRERLFSLYDDQQKFRVRQSNKRYSVLMRFPKQNLNQVSSLQ